MIHRTKVDGHNNISLMMSLQDGIKYSDEEKLESPASMA